MASSDCDGSDILEKGLESVHIEPTAPIQLPDIGPSNSWDMGLGPFRVSMAHPDTIEDVKIKYRILSWCDQKDKSVDKVLAKQATEYLTKKCFQAFRLAYLGGFENVECALEKINKLRSTFEDHEETLQNRYGCDGFYFVLESAYRQIMLSAGCSLAEVNSRPAIPYEELSELSKATVMAVVVIFNRTTGHCNKAQRALIEEALKIGTEIPEWHHLHFQILRSIRRDDENTFRNAPPVEESNALGHAFRLDPENKDYLISIAKTMFDFIKYGERPDWPYTIGGLLFPTRGSAIESLCSRIRKILEDNPKNEEANLLAGAVFVSGRVPPALKDSEFAKSCIDTVLEVNPINPKALHRLGQWHLNQSRDTEAAKIIFKKAMMADPLDYLPAIDYFWAICADLREENVVTMDEGLAKGKLCKWPSHALLDIMFVKGCLLLGAEIDEGEDLAVREFREAFRLSPEYFGTRCHTLNGSVRRNLWKPNTVSLDKLLTCLKKYKEVDDQQLTDMIRAVEEVCEKKNRPMFPRESGTSGNWRDRSQLNENGGGQLAQGGSVYSGGTTDGGIWRSKSRSENVEGSGGESQNMHNPGGRYNPWDRNGSGNDGGIWVRGGHSNRGGYNSDRGGYNSDRGGSSSRRGSSSDRGWNFGRGSYGNYGRGGNSIPNGGHSGDLGEADLDGNWRNAPKPKPMEQNKVSETNGSDNSEENVNRTE